jgi:hypothetical protein
MLWHCFIVIGSAENWKCVVRGTNKLPKYEYWFHPQVDFHSFSLFLSPHLIYWLRNVGMNKKIIRKVYEQYSRKHMYLYTSYYICIGSNVYIKLSIDVIRKESIFIFYPLFCDEGVSKRDFFIFISALCYCSCEYYYDDVLWVERWRNKKFQLIDNHTQVWM